jgi:CheY-like chemotaxis protein
MASDSHRVPLRIYVIENDVDTRQMLTMLLKLDGHSVDVGTTMGEALNHLATRRYDVLISDIGLPDGSGWELLSRLKAQGTSGPPYAIAMSGYGLSADVQRSLDSGFREHLIKPVDIEQLERILGRAAVEIGAGR